MKKGFVVIESLLAIPLLIFVSYILFACILQIQKLKHHTEKILHLTNITSEMLEKNALVELDYLDTKIESIPISSNLKKIVAYAQDKQTGLKVSFWTIK